MSKLRFVLFILLAYIMTACALGDVSNGTSRPPMTLPSPPALNLAGTCDDTKTLETWLQITSELRTNFQTTMNTAAAKDKPAMYADVSDLAALRDSVFSVATPDCAGEVGIKLGDAMTQAVSSLQAFINGDAPDLGNTILNVNAQIDDVAAAQDELINRMNTQFQQLATVVP